MASILPRGAYFFLKFKQPDGSWGRRKLPVRVDDPDAKRKCAMALATEQLREAAMIRAGQAKLRGWGWVPGFFRDHYTNAKSLQRALNGWAPVSVFLESHRISEPAMVKFAHGAEYVRWRQNPPKEHGIKPRSKNTALLEVKFLSRVMQEAVRLELALANPLYRLGIRKTPPKEKVEFTREEQELVQRALADEPGWMADAWQVAMKQGCRLGHTATLMKDVDEQAMTIFLLEQKGKRHLAPLHPDLLPLVRRRRAEGAERLVDVPRVPGVAWWKFFRRIGLGHHCYHDTRATVITRAARAGLPEAQVMKYVGHANATVHGIYRKLKADDVAHVGNVL